MLLSYIVPYLSSYIYLFSPFVQSIAFCNPQRKNTLNKPNQIGNNENFIEILICITSL